MLQAIIYSVLLVYRQQTIIPYNLYFTNSIFYLRYNLYVRKDCISLSFEKTTSGSQLFRDVFTFNLPDDRNAFCFDKKEKPVFFSFKNIFTLKRLLPDESLLKLLKINGWLSNGISKTIRGDESFLIQFCR